MELKPGYKQTEVGVIPEDWETKSLKGEISISHGFAFASQHFTSHGSYRLTTPGHFYEAGGFRDIGEKQKYYVGPVPIDYVLQPGDVIIAMTEQADGLLGSAAVIPQDAEERAGYGEAIVSALGRQLTAAYGRGFSAKSLHHMIRFAESFPDEEKVSALRRQLSWTHLKSLIYLDDPLKRDFYVELCLLEGWSSRQLQERIQSMLFERSVISRKPEQTIQADLQALRQSGRPSVDLLLKDPYLLDFLGLNDRYLEKDLEDAILREMEQFLLELGVGFTFVARQKRLQIDEDDFYIDLLFYNRKLKRLVAIDLKLGKFKAEYKGQMELYLRWLAKYEQEVDENPPLGIILCAGKKEEQIELLELDHSSIHVAEYLTVLPSHEMLREKLHQSVQNARLRLFTTQTGDENE